MLVDLQPTETTHPDYSDIPTYVVRPPRPQANRYQAPRLSRTSLRELRDLQDQESWTWRLAENWRLHRTVSVASVKPLEGRHFADPVGVMRYSARTRPVYPGMAGEGGPRGRAITGAGVMLVAGTLGVMIGMHLPTPSPANATAYVPASTLIASQNLPAKLPFIEKQGHGTPLESGTRPGNVTYLVQAGDSFASVGRRFGLRPRTVRLVNMLPIGARLRDGQRLVITPFDGAYHRARAGETLKELAERYNVTPAALSQHNPGLKAEALVAEQSVFIPGAMEIRYKEPHAIKQRGYRTTEPWAKRLSVSRSLVGAFGSRVGELAWPAAGQLSSPFGIRGFSFHPGVDICNAVGTPIRAAKGGTILSAGWMGAYGYAVDIDHGGGVVTRYGHCSRLEVAAGQNVEAGQEIARMGSTGRSTGPHVHFEVRLQGRAVNPTSFF